MNLSQLSTPRLMRWYGFNVLVALTPFMLNYLFLITRASTVRLTNLFPKGEMLLISAAIVAGALGELIGSVQPSDKNKIRLQIFFGACCVLLLIIQSAWFASVSSSDVVNLPYNEVGVAKGSLLLFGFSFVISSICMIISEPEEKT